MRVIISVASVECISLLNLYLTFNHIDSVLSNNNNPNFAIT